MAASGRARQCKRPGNALRKCALLADRNARHRVAAFACFELASGAEMPARRPGRTYVMTAPYPSGTRFQVFVTSPQPAYLYVFGFDRLEKSYRIFPRDPDDRATRAAFQNRIVIPDEEHYVQMDATTGTEYLCVVFARQPLPFATILQRWEGTRGPFLTRLQTILDADLLQRSSSGTRKPAASGLRLRAVGVLSCLL